MDHAGLHLSGCCITPSTKERKLVESKLLAKPNPSTTANSPNENDDVINIGEYNIDGAPIESVQTTTSMMTDVVAPSTERGGVPGSIHPATRGTKYSVEASPVIRECSFSSIYNFDFSKNQTFMALSMHQT